MTSTARRSWGSNSRPVFLSGVFSFRSVCSRLLGGSAAALFFSGQARLQTRRSGPFDDGFWLSADPDQFRHWSQALSGVM